MLVTGFAGNFRFGRNLYVPSACTAAPFSGMCLCLFTIQAAQSHCDARCQQCLCLARCQQYCCTTVAATVRLANGCMALVPLSRTFVWLLAQLLLANKDYCNKRHQVLCHDRPFDSFTTAWSRIYVPNQHRDIPAPRNAQPACKICIPGDCQGHLVSSSRIYLLQWILLPP